MVADDNGSPRRMDRSTIKRMAQIRGRQRDRDNLAISDQIQGGQSPFLTPAGVAPHAYSVVPDGCHIWQGYASETAGPLGWFEGKLVTVRRHVYRCTFPSEPIHGSDVLPCGNFLCVNPDHLTLRPRSQRPGPKPGHRRHRLLTARGVVPEAYDVDIKTNCHVWKYGTTGTGHPTASRDGRVVTVRRWLYRLLTGIEPQRLMGLPNCGNNKCVNPVHFVPKHLIRTRPKKPSWKGPQWQPWEDDFLREHRHLADKQLAAELERPRASVSARKLKLGLTHTRQACIDCGKFRAIRPGARCSACAANHRSEWRRAYFVRYHEKTRPAPAPIPQRDPTLPPIGLLIYQPDGAGVQCHVCGEFKGSLVMHVRVHGYNADSYKEAFGLGRTWSLLSPATAEKFRENAITRDQGGVGRIALKEIGPGRNPGGQSDRIGTRVRKSESSIGKPKNR